MFTIICDTSNVTNKYRRRKEGLVKDQTGIPSQLESHNITIIGKGAMKGHKYD